MSSTYTKFEEVIKVEAAAGIDAYAHEVRKILRRPRVQQVTITAGSIKYTRLLAEGESPNNVGEDMPAVTPYAIVRSKGITECAMVPTNAAVAFAAMFAKAAEDGLHPVALASGSFAQTAAWFKSTTGLQLKHGELFGVPFLLDNKLPEEAVVLCAAYGKDAALVDVVRSYKLTIPQRV